MLKQKDDWCTKLLQNPYLCKHFRFFAPSNPNFRGMKGVFCGILLCLIAVSQTVSGQVSDFENYYLNAMDAFKDRRYDIALYYFDQALRLKPRDADASYYAGICYLEKETSDDEDSRRALKTLSSVDKEKLSDPVNFNYWMAEANYRNERFAAARKYIESYLQQQKTPRKRLAKELFEYITKAKSLYGDKGAFAVENLGAEFNTPDHEFAFSMDFAQQKAIFTRTETGSGNPLKDNYQPSGRQSRGVFLLTESLFDAPYNLDAELPIDENTFLLSITKYNKFDGTEQLLAHGEEGILVLSFLKGRWKIRRLDIDEKGLSQKAIHATIRQDNTLLVFTAPGKGGDLDLFQTRYTKESGWEKPEAIDPLNSEGDEITPFLSQDGNTLYFSSTGHGAGTGRFDIFYSRLQPDKAWSAPESMQYPVNTTADEAYFSIYDSVGYFSSNRAGGQGGADLYRMYNFRYLSLRGTVSDRYTEKVVPDCEIRILKAGTAKGIDTLTTNEDGFYQIENLPVGEPLQFFLIHEGKLRCIDNFRSTGMLVADRRDQELVHNFYIHTTDEGITDLIETATPAFNPFPEPEPGSRFILRTVKFRSGTTELLPASLAELDRFAAFIRAHPELPIIEIGGHTDNVGDAKANLRLSEQRAERVKSYLVEEHGLVPERFTTRGYGETQPIASNDDERDGRELNRRIEAKLLE